MTMNNHVLIFQGFRLLRDVLASYIVGELRSRYGEDWWQKGVLEILHDDQKRSLPDFGDVKTLADSLDVQRCLLLLDIQWNAVFCQKLSPEHRTWAKELVGFRNRLAHIGGQDFSGDDTWRALDTMARLCERLDAEKTTEIRELIRIVCTSFSGGDAPSLMSRQPLPSTQKNREENIVVGDALKSNFAAGIAAGESPIVINANIRDSLRSTVNITTHQHYHAQRICPVCSKKVHDEENFFSCIHCHRGPVHERCGDMGLTLCRACLETLEAQEKRRERCVPLLLSAKAGSESLSFFLFAKSPLQMGRAKQKSLEKISRLPGHSYVPRDNDIVARVFGVAGKLSEEASLCTSRRHIALRVLKANDRECLKACDCGTRGEGSECGTWTDEGPLPKAQWADLADSCELCLGKSPDFIHRGLTLEVTVYRGTQDNNQIDCVLIERKDALLTHRYVLVYRTAYVGLGECALSLRKKSPTFPWGKVLYDETSSSFIYEAFPRSPLISNFSSPCRLTPETVIAGGEIEISVRNVSETMFAPGGI